MKRTTLVLMLLTIGVSASCRKVEPAAAVPGKSSESAARSPVIATASGREMVLVPAGRFRMGSERGEPDEAPVHEVSIGAFWMDRCEVTQAAWARLAPQSEFLSVDPSHFKGPGLPVEMVSWDMAALFCNVRSRAEGLQPCYDEETGACDFDSDGYRLPTEAEWEYACRAGSASDYHFGSDSGELDDYAWYSENSGKKTHPAAQKKPNAWGLFDMHGNVAEWCNDRYSESYHRTSPADNPRGPDDAPRYVLRGGAWNCTAEACRSARRVGEDPGVADACFARDAIGFRCVRKTPQKAAPHMVHYRPKLRTGFAYGEVYLQHQTGPSHPERPERLTAIVQRLKTAGLLEQLERISPRKADLHWVKTVHGAEYLERLQRAHASETGWIDSPDTPASAKSYDVALAAVGGVLAAIDAVVEGRIGGAFCAVRPPGHHALPNRAMGFCLLNNVAIAARYLQAKHRISKILIVDWDVHHGNGTQAIFYDDPMVFYFSVHQSPFYPGTGDEEERGEDEGLGYTLNVPLPAGSDDQDYQKVFQEILEPAARRFDPDFVLVSAGFDAHEDDPLGGMQFTARQYAEMTRTVKQIAEECCQGRVVSVLEGGYSLEGLAASVEAHIRVLLE